ncbi:MAG: DNA recombination protein RmuC [Streptosporangiales bacterium]|nr:DNA recombination protein RmuC [Streptosporangiales bacterium]
MGVITVVLLVTGLLVGAGAGAAIGVLLSRSRDASLRGERDSLVVERDRLRADVERASAALRQAENEAAGLRATVDTERRAAAERAALVERTMTERFTALSSAALAQSNEQFLRLADERFKEAQTKATGELDQRRQAVEHMVAPLKDTLAKVEAQLRELEQARVAAYHSLTEQVGLVRQTGEHLRHETASLANALRAPQVRGRWGELQLERIVELAGMSEQCDFTRQGTVDTDDGQRRPDLVVHLAGGKSVVVDSKVPLSSYLEAVESTDETRRRGHLGAHARNLRRHVDQLAAKEYWAAFSPAPEFVVLFVPGEAFLAPALEHDPQLLEHAMSRHVVIATPTTLMSMLRTVAYAWQQAALTDNAREVFDLGRQLYDRLGKLGDRVDGLGKAITRVVSAYNGTVASLETRVLVSARRMRDLQLVEGDLPTPRPVEETPRAPSTAELVESAGEARQIRLLYASDPTEEDGEPVDERYGVTPETARDRKDRPAAR